MMEGNIWQLLAGFVAAMGIPSAIMGLIVWRLEGRISKRERDHEEQDKSQKDLIVLLVQSTSASIALGEATAKAVQRIPDAHCNGDMHAALEYATNIKHKQKEFLTKQESTLCWTSGDGFSLCETWAKCPITPSLTR